jgi:hypothetical protein
MPVYQTLDELAPGLWVASRGLRLFVGDIGCRMTVIRLANGGLFLHSPVSLDDALRAALDRLGPVRWIVGPSKVHHFFLADYALAYPGAFLCAAPGLPEKRADLRFQHVLDDSQPPPWGAEIALRLFRGAPLMNEVTFFHPATRTLVLTDLASRGPTADAPAGSIAWSAPPVVLARTASSGWGSGTALPHALRSTRCSPGTSTA